MDYKQINDYEVLYLINDNDETAYSLIFDKYKPVITSLANSYYKKFYNLGLEYDDLYQEGMLGLSYAVKCFDFKSKNTFYTFAILCIKRTMQKIIIKSIRNKNMLLNTSFSFEENLCDDCFSLSDVLFSENDLVGNVLDSIYIQEKILNCKYYLSNKQMPVYELKLNGFSNIEIAALLDLTYKEVDNCLYSIKKILKKINITDAY